MHTHTRANTLAIFTWSIVSNTGRDVERLRQIRTSTVKEFTTTIRSLWLIPVFQMNYSDSGNSLASIAPICRRN